MARDLLNPWALEKKKQQTNHYLFFRVIHSHWICWSLHWIFWFLVIAHWWLYWLFSFVLLFQRDVVSF